MNLDKINTWLSLLANFGVLVGVLFLVLEMQQNSQLMRSQTRDSLAEKNVEWRYAIAGNMETAQLFADGPRIMGDPQFDAEYFALASLYDARLRIWENELYQYQQGLYDEGEFRARLDSWKYNFRNKPDIAIFWEIRRGSYSQEFTDLIDSVIAETE